MRVSVLPGVRSEVPAVYVGKVALDSVGVRVGPSGLRLDLEETLPALLDERSVMSSGTDSAFGSGKALDGGHMEGAPVLEPIEHSVLEKPLDGRPLLEMSVSEPLEHSVPDVAPSGVIVC